ncbi:addiction module protein [Thermococcus sp.]|uniref:addiction module protein n=1 Tax=Thermococcus sp. TaxID=35749 RepID=UPI0026274200|nr:addiction module protein [Thermococcus sp.]
MSEAINPNVLLQRIDQMERELEKLRLEVLKMRAENLPEEEVDEETLKDLEKRFEEYKSGKAKVVSGEEAVRILTQMLED